MDGFKRGWGDPLRIYLLCAPVLYLLFAFLTPPFQTPDEHQHVFRAYQLSRFELVGERRDKASGGLIAPGLVSAATAELSSAEPHYSGAGLRRLPQTTLAQRWARATPLAADAPPVFANFLGSAPYSPAGYGPQVIAVWLGEAAGLSVENIVRLGRALNAVLTILLFIGAFRTLPMGRNLLLWLGLMPMTAACAGAFGQDGTVIGASAWLVALGLRAVLTRVWPRRDAIVAGTLAIIVTLAKMIYLPLAALALFPMAKGRPAWRSLGTIVLIGLPAALILLLWLRAVAPIVQPMSTRLALPGDQVAFMLHHPYETLHAVFTTFRVYTMMYIGQLFVFGWLNIGPVGNAMLPTLAALAIVLILGDQRGAELPLIWRLWSLVVVGAIMVLMALALYIGGNTLGAKVIDGLQGRYFIPVLVPMLLPFVRSRQGNERWGPALIATLLLAANAAALHAIYTAFYIA